jgi:DNA-binding MarR family transcriptional regulator
MVQKSPNTTRLMDKLCDKGFIDRVRCENDRRVVYVKISTAGLTLLNEITIEEFDNCLTNISESDAKKLNEILDKIR